MSTRQRRPIKRIAAVTLPATIALAAAASPASAADTKVAIVSSHYRPTPVTVQVGDTVTWTNEGFLLHNVTSENGEFVSPTLHGGQSYSVTFTKPGTFGYVCTIHPEMTGKVVVNGTSDTAPSGGKHEPAMPAPPRLTAPTGSAHLSLKLTRSTHHARFTEVTVSSARPGARVVLQLYSAEHFAWIQIAHATLNATGAARFRLRAGLHREVRAVIPGAPGEAPSVSHALRS